jgi:hypothetical protein
MHEEGDAGAAHATNGPRVRDHMVRDGAHDGNVAEAAVVDESRCRSRLMRTSWVPGGTSGSTVCSALESEDVREKHSSSSSAWTNAGGRDCCC